MFSCSSMADFMVHAWMFQAICGSPSFSGLKTKQYGGFIFPSLNVFVDQFATFISCMDRLIMYIVSGFKYLFI